MPKKKYEYVRKTARYDGKKYEAYGKTEREAMLKLADKLAAAKRGEETVSGDMSVNAWFQRWLETYKEPKNLTGKSLSMYGEKYRNYIKPEIGGMRLKDVKDIHLQRILNGQSGKSASHVQKIRMILREMFRRARQSRLIIYDPAETLELPAVTRGHRRSLTDDERASILEVARTHPHGLWILTLLYTGIRPGESAALTWDDVDFERGELHIHAARESGARAIKGPKTLSGVRDIPIHRDLLEKLTAARREASGGVSAWVFPGVDGKPADDNTFRRWWKSFLRAVDISRGAIVYRNQIKKSTLAPDLTLYCLRHTFCTDLQRAGVPLNIAKELMGHSDVTVTANIYTHRDTATLHAGIALLEGAGITGGKSGGKNL